MPGLKQLLAFVTNTSTSTRVGLSYVPGICWLVVVLSLTLTPSLDAHSVFNINHYSLHIDFPFLLVAAGCTEAPSASFPGSQRGRRSELH